MSKEENKLSVVGIEIPNGPNTRGIKVKLSNGQYLSGIQSITLHADTDNQSWQLSLKLLPRFVDQEVINAVIADIEIEKKELAPRNIHAIENKIANLQEKLDWWKQYEQPLP